MRMGGTGVCDLCSYVRVWGDLLLSCAASAYRRVRARVRVYGLFELYHPCGRPDYVVGTAPGSLSTPYFTFCRPSLVLTCCGIIIIHRLLIFAPFFLPLETELINNPPPEEPKVATPPPQPRPAPSSASSADSRMASQIEQMKVRGLRGFSLSLSSCVLETICMIYKAYRKVTSLSLSVRHNLLQLLIGIAPN